MGRITTGICFCFIGAFLVVAQYITVAILSLGPNWRYFSFESSIEDVGKLPLYLGIAFFVLGVPMAIFGKENNR
ncbi:hypothetical protein NDK47_19190 [Brevibacillus ruminantium]|uniref:Uncharacterized protein n=1 Tax=Brevibacillus ruminantium TaxID=2950604 RepID=A0ABY4WAQ9_9BACL|nr:hypothetical protein [Brevibacillus ruminantium]USG64266.1 hypothetical protein NDK47_19190 [Brevibacillus ruminantium]